MASIPKGVEPKLVKRAGVYNIVWYDAATKRTGRIGLRTRDHAKAVARLNAVVNEEAFAPLVAGSGGDAGGLTVEGALDDYWCEHANARDDRGRQIVADPKRQENAITHLKAWFGDRLLKDVNALFCQGYAKARRAGTIGGGRRKKGELRRGSDSTIRREITVLRAASAHALKFGRITLAEYPTFDAPSEPKVEQEVGWLTKYQVATLIFEAKGGLREFIILAYLWGARRASIETLTVEQVDLAHNRVTLAKAGARATKKRRPTVPIYPGARAALERLLADVPAGDSRLFLTDGRRQSKHAPKDDRVQTVPDFYQPFRALCESLGMPYSHPHVLRHSRATHLLMDNVPIFKVARLLGDTVATVERVYGHHSVDFLMEDAA